MVKIRAKLAYIRMFFTLANNVSKIEEEVLIIIINNKKIIITTII